jgi:hypothetical protein
MTNFKVIYPKKALVKLELLSLQEYMSSLPDCFPFRSTWGHSRTAFPSGVTEFTPGLLFLQEYPSSLPDCFPFRSTSVHSRTAFPSGAPEFTLGLFSLPEHMSSLPDVSEVHVAQSVVFCVVFCKYMFVNFFFSFWSL